MVAYRENSPRSRSRHVPAGARFGPAENGGNCDDRDSLASQRLPGPFKWAEYKLNSQPPDFTGHVYFNCVSAHTSEQCESDRRKHGNATRRDIGLIRVDECIYLLLSGSEIYYPEPGVHPYRTSGKAPPMRSLLHSSRSARAVRVGFDLGS